jgi:hypothetical protein
MLRWSISETLISLYIMSLDAGDEMSIVFIPSLWQILW